MTSRADLVEAAARALADWDREPGDPRRWRRDLAAQIVDRVLPQVTNPEEWVAFPFGAIAVSPGGTVIHRTVDPDELRHWWGRETLFPLTVVWQPSADRVTT